MGVLHNPSQERFCQIVHRLTLDGEKRGAARTAAYREAIHQGNASDKDIAPNARRFANLPKIKVRIAEIAEFEAKLAGMDRVWLVIQVKDMIEANGKDRVPAASLMMKLQGWAAPDRHEFSGPDGGPIPTMEYTEDERLRAFHTFLAKMNKQAEA